jgi:REP element-mobilizing transposase RayT
MPYRKSPIQIDQIYHLYNRGVDKNNIFFQKSDWEHFYHKMQYYFKPKHVSVLAYCLMPNHFHLLIEVHSEQLISKVLQPFFASYVTSVNKYHQRVGPLFQGPFKSKEVDSDQSLIHLSRYIHRNPVEAGIITDINEWRYSSYPVYSGQKNDEFIKTDLILSIMGGVILYEKFVLDYSKNELDKNLTIDH